jgi:hypothetical protein
MLEDFDAESSHTYSDVWARLPLRRVYQTEGHRKHRVCWIVFVYRKFNLIVVSPKGVSSRIVMLTSPACGGQWECDRAGDDKKKN